MKKTQCMIASVLTASLVACGSDNVGSSSPASSSQPSSSQPSNSSSVSSQSVSSVVSSVSSASSQSPNPGNGGAGVRPAKIEGFGASTTGGAGGAVVTARTGTEINRAICERGSMTDPVTIYVDGTINHGNTEGVGCNTADDKIEIKGTSNISIIGVGNRAVFDQIGIHMRDASNIVVQNVHIKNVKKSGSPISNGGDAIGMESGVSHVWIDHNTLEASGGESSGYDSLIDMKASVTDVTVSYNLLRDSSRGGLIGSSDSDDQNTRITFHHNFYKNIQQRTPLLRHGLAHSYNNYWQNDDINYMYHGINARMGGRVLVEGNYFHNTNNILLASDDSSEPGCWQTNNDNTITPRVHYSRSVGDGALVVPEVNNGQLQSTCSVSVPYAYQLESSANIPNVVVANAGHGIIDGGGVRASTPPSTSNPTPVSSSSSIAQSSSTPANINGGTPDGSNIASSGGADGTSKASGTSYGHVVDGDQSTFWSPQSTSGERISVKFPNAVTISGLTIREPTSTVTSWTLENNDNGQTLASGQYIGNSLNVSFAPISAKKLNLLLNSASSIPMITEIEVYGSGSAPTAPPTNSGSSSNNAPVNNGGGVTGNGTGATCSSTGSQSVNSTIIVAAGQTFDGQCKTFNPTFGGGSQEEGQPPVFRVEHGGTLKNVIIGLNGADGIHLYGDATVDNITWLDVGEDALTVKSAGNVVVRNITGSSADDKFFQLNAQTTFRLENCKINGAGKIFRENGGKCYPVNVTVNQCSFSNVKEAIFRSDCSSSTFGVSNSSYNNVDEICYSGGSYRSCGEI